MSKYTKPEGTKMERKTCLREIPLDDDDEWGLSDDEPEEKKQRMGDLTDQELQAMADANVRAEAAAEEKAEEEKELEKHQKEYFESSYREIEFYKFTPYLSDTKSIEQDITDVINYDFEKNQNKISSIQILINHPNNDILGAQSHDFKRVSEGFTLITIILEDTPILAYKCNAFSGFPEIHSIILEILYRFGPLYFLQFYEYTNNFYKAPYAILPNINDHWFDKVRLINPNVIGCKFIPNYDDNYEKIPFRIHDFINLCHILRYRNLPENSYILSIGSWPSEIKDYEQHRAFCNYLCNTNDSLITNKIQLPHWWHYEPFSSLSYGDTESEYYIKRKKWDKNVASSSTAIFILFDLVTIGLNDTDSHFGKFLTQGVYDPRLLLWIELFLYPNIPQPIPPPLPPFFHFGNQQFNN